MGILFNKNSLEDYLVRAKNKGKKEVTIRLHSDDSSYRVYVEYRKKCPKSLDKGLANLLISDTYFEKKRGLIDGFEDWVETWALYEALNAAKEIEDKGLKFRVLKSGLGLEKDLHIENLDELNRFYRERLEKLV